MSMPAAPSDARRMALTGLVDFAGLFPPARLAMADAAAEYRRIKASAESWFVDRFICPAEMAGGLGDHDAGGFPLSLVASRELPELSPELNVVMIELKGTVPDGLLPAPAVVEVGWQDGDRMGARLAELAGDERVLGAKLRCGGLTADMFPPPAGVAAFMVQCRRLGLPYKLTAGLHHAHRHQDPATGFPHHGFVNLLAAEVLGRAHDLDAGTMAEIVADPDPGAFTLDAHRLAWRELAAAPSDIAAARRDGLLAYGSCDVAEPLADLAALGMLPLEPAA